MPFTNDLQAAGDRAALQPVPAPLPIAEIQQNASKQRTKRRMAGGALAAVALAAASVPIALNVGGTTSIQTVSAGQATEQVAPPASNSGIAAAAQDESQDSEDQAAGFNFGDDIDLSVKVLQGNEAAAAGAAAAASAEETIDVDGQALWVVRNGDRVTVSALLEDDTFIEVQGPADQLDRLLEIARAGGNGDFNLFFDFDHGDGNGFSFDGDFGDLEKFFGPDGQLPNLEEFFGPNSDFEQFFGENGDFENFFGPGSDFSQFFGEDGQFEQFFGPDGQLPNLEEFFGENGDFEDFFGNGGAGIFGENFEGCISLDFDSDTDGQFDFEYPQGCDS